MWNNEYIIYACFFADLSKFKGGGLGLGRRHTKSYEVCSSFFFFLANFTRTFFEDDCKSRTAIQVLSAIYNRISVLLLRVTVAVISFTVIAKSAHHRSC